jgi:hypothetical protein
MVRFRVLMLVSITIALMTLSPVDAHADGRDYAFYNGDVCKAMSLQYCLSQSGNMLYGTFFLGVYGNNERWRAGSGDGVSTNRCLTDHGPIPRANADILQHYDNKSDGSIHGRAWRLPDLHCIWGDPASQYRTQLFFHTEETPTQGQTCGTPYDEHWCWDGASDYASQGCVKIKRSDIAVVDTRWHSGSDSTPRLVIDA